MDISKIVVVLFALLYFCFILYTRRKGNFEEFSVAGRSLGSFLIFATISASYIGPAMTLGLSRDGFSNGWMLAFIATFGGLGMIIVAQFIAPKIRTKFTYSFSIGDVIGGPKSHNHKAVKIAVGIMSTWLMASIAIAMSYAGGELVNNVFGFSKIWSIAIITSIVIVYSFFGGIRATIQTDAFQFVNFIVLIPILGLLIILSQDFNWAEYISQTKAVTSKSWDGQTATALFGMYLFWFISSAGLDAPMVSRYLSARNAGVVKRSTTFAGIFLSLWVLVMVFIGSAGAYLHPDLANTDQVLLYIAEFYFSELFYGVFIIAMIGVVMSTQDSALNSASVAFSEDVLSGINPNLSERQKLIYAKLFTIIIGLSAIIIAGYLNSILHAIIVIFSFYMPVMIPVTLFSVLKKKHYWASAIGAMLVGFFSYLLAQYFDWAYAPPTLFGMMISALSYWVIDKAMERR